MHIFQIHGKPVPWSAGKSKRGHFYDPRSVEKENIRWQIRSQYRDEPLKGRFCLEFVFNIPIPKTISAIRKRQMLANLIGPIGRPDTTNYQKLYEDCLIGIVIDDDAGVTRIISEKKYSEKPGVLIKLFKYEELYPEIEDNSTI